MAKKLTMKGLLSKKRKAPTPPALVKHIRDLLIFVNGNMDVLEQKRKDKKMADLAKSMLEMRTLLYGDGESEPNKEACAQLTQEFFKDDTFRLLIVCLSKLSLETRRNATHVVANLQRQQVQSRLVASDYMEKNMNLMNILIPGYEDYEIALSCGAISRECIRHQTVARYVLESDHMKKFFYYIQIPNFEIASDAAATFKELMTRHKSTVAQFLSSNYDWFFQEYNSQLLHSQNYITKRQALKLLRDILLDRANCDITVRYVCSLDNMRILMNLLRDPNKTIQLETFHVFKLFVANQNKPPEIVNVLVTNRSKLLRFLGDFKTEKENEQFEEDKAAIIREISLLEGVVIKEFSSILSFRQNCEIPC